MSAVATGSEEESPAPGGLAGRLTAVAGLVVGGMLLVAVFSQPQAHAREVPGEGSPVAAPGSGARDDEQPSDDGRRATLPPLVAVLPEGQGPGEGPPATGADDTGGDPPGSQRDEPVSDVDRAVDEVLSWPSGERDVDTATLSDRIYHEIYNAPAQKPTTISEDDYWDGLMGYDGVHDRYQGWHRRGGHAGQPDRSDVRRIYLNVLPDSGPELADGLSGALNERGIKFMFKTPLSAERAAKLVDSAVLYVQGKDYSDAEDLVLKYADEHPSMFADGHPSFTQPLRPGIATAQEPLQDLQPDLGDPDHMWSFGESRSAIIAEAIVNAPEDATPEEIEALVRANFWKYGVDPDRPWETQAATDTSAEATPEPDGQDDSADQSVAWVDRGGPEVYTTPAEWLQPRPDSDPPPPWQLGSEPEVTTTPAEWLQPRPKSDPVLDPWMLGGGFEVYPVPGPELLGGGPEGLGLPPEGQLFGDDLSPFPLPPEWRGFGLGGARFPDLWPLDGGLPDSGPLGQA